MLRVGYLTHDSSRLKLRENGHCCEETNDSEETGEWQGSCGKSLYRCSVFDCKFDVFLGLLSDRNWSGQSHFLPPSDLQIVRCRVSLFACKTLTANCEVFVVQEKPSAEFSLFNLFLNFVASSLERRA
jgi:hypothetical protein